MMNIHVVIVDRLHELPKDIFDKFSCHYVLLDNEYRYSDFNNKNNFNVIHLNAYSIRPKCLQLIEKLNNLPGKGVNMHASLLCETHESVEPQ